MTSVQQERFHGIEKTIVKLIEDEDYDHPVDATVSILKSLLARMHPKENSIR